MRNYDILICKDDSMSLPVHVCDTIQQACNWIGCKRDTLYKSIHLNGCMKAKGYIVELIEREV